LNDSLYRVIIPARFGSTRLPGKVLIEIAGKPLLQHVYEAACQSSADKVFIATDSKDVLHCAESFNANCLMTSSKHFSGTERLAEAASLLELQPDDIVVNVQGDEIDLPAKLIDQVARLLMSDPKAAIATLCEKVDPKTAEDPNIVKVVFNKKHEALYFSRSLIPWHKESREDGSACYRHIGLYAYRVGFLEEYSRLEKCRLEIDESLEQLRALYHGARILVNEASAHAGIGVDTKEDLEEARSRLENRL